MILIAKPPKHKYSGGLCAVDKTCWGVLARVNLERNPFVSPHPRESVVYVWDVRPSYEVVVNPQRYYQDLNKGAQGCVEPKQFPHPFVPHICSVLAREPQYVGLVRYQVGLPPLPP